MIDYEEYMQIKILYKQGKSIREISRLLKVSRNTVRRYLKQEQKPSYKIKEITRISKLAPFYEYLQERIKAAHPNWLPATVLYQEIIAMGYQGKISLLRYHLQRLKPVQPIEPIIRFETAPGQQMQVDWIEFRKGKNRLSAFVATLGFSRATFVEFVANEKLETLLTCHEQAFEYFGGVPEEILYDNMKTVVIMRDAYALGQHRFQPGFLDFARHYGFVPKLCRPYRARTKGKVERFNRYLRHSFYNPLISRLKPLGLVLDKELANYEVKRWLRDVANQRVHGTTGKVPAVVLKQEQVYLQPLSCEYTGIRRTLPATRLLLSEVHSLQHPLSVYDALLQGAFA